MFPTEAVAEETFSGNSYEVVAWANRQRVLYYAQFGSYQGEWVLVAKASDGAYHIYKDWYGSCSGCDAFESDSPSTRAEAELFAQKYPAFLIVPPDTMRNVVADGVLESIMPANIRESGEITWPELVADVSALVKLEEGLPLVSADILSTRNAEVKQRILKAVGYDRFLADCKPDILDRHGDDELLKVGEIVLVHLKDTSTARRYLLRVPPSVKSVRDAVAWTFNMRSSDYAPLLES